jgi:hypothetical protein
MSRSSREGNWCRRLPRDTPDRCWMREVVVPAYPTSAKHSTAAESSRSLVSQARCCVGSAGTRVVVTHRPYRRVPSQD